MSKCIRCLGLLGDKEKEGDKLCKECKKHLYYDGDK